MVIVVIVTSNIVLFDTLVSEFGVKVQPIIEIISLAASKAPENHRVL